MKTTVTKSDFRDAFHRMGRSEQFSYEGLGALFDYLEDVHPDTNEEAEFQDVIAYCCKFTEYENIAEFQDNYGKGDYPDMESINNATMVIEIDDTSFIIQDF